MYMGLKHLHMLCAVLSIASFTLRGIWMLTESPLLNKKFVRIAPHIIDTLLLVTAFSLAFVTSQYPFVDGWLTAKLLGLIVYIVLGVIALKKGKTKTVRGAAFILALVTFAYIFGVAHFKNAAFFL
jgi:uncharacterized membrane protein SirB2